VRCDIAKARFGKQVFEIPDFGQELPCKRFTPRRCDTVIGLMVRRFCIKDVFVGVTELPFQTMELLPSKSRHGKPLVDNAVARLLKRPGGNNIPREAGQPLSHEDYKRGSASGPLIAPRLG
jgi:hypothetical protein